MVYNQTLLLEVEWKSHSVWEKKNYWLKNNLYHLYFKNKEILGSPMAWLIDCIMDATQKLICMKLGAINQFYYPSVRYTENVLMHYTKTV